MGHIWLIGMMGTGKTSIGARLAARLGMPFIDVDALVEEETGRSIADLFTAGEEIFRNAEHNAISAVASREIPHVVATGGGSVLDPNNVATMRRTGQTVLLTAPIEVMIERVMSDGSVRPLGRSADDIVRIAGERRHVYGAAADIVVDTGGRSIDETVEEVMRCVDT